jgi:hypothetical protein
MMVSSIGDVVDLGATISVGRAEERDKKCLIIWQVALKAIEDIGWAPPAMY